MEHSEYFLDSELWPEGCVIGKYRPPKQHYWPKERKKPFFTSQTTANGESLARSIAMSKDGLNPRDSRQTKLYIVCLNIQSLRSKLGQLEVVLEHNPTDILCLNEHWLTEDEVPMYVPKDFTIGSSYCRKPLKTHGGSLILVRDGIQYETVDSFLQGDILHKSFAVGSICPTPDSGIFRFVDVQPE
ncbi:hypothetical protein J6590_065402 [Homalodisca vitripennis]|nr:hypothetical protein J6590_065402 [Homalodisca vitripennis]